MRARGRARAVTLVAVSAIVTAPLWYLACVIADAPESGKPCPPCSDGYLCDTYSIFDGGPEGGQCVPIAAHPCDAGQVYCGGYGCTDLETDPANCGACSRSCGPGKGSTILGCEAGQCVVLGCGIGWAVPEDGGACESNYDTDLACWDAGCLCGEQTCSPGYVCGNAQAFFGLNGPYKAECACYSSTACGSAAEGAACIIDGGTDARGGLCACDGSVCAGGEQCNDGACSCNDGPRCPPAGPGAHVECCPTPTGCTDIFNVDNLQNCGACGAQCPLGLHCHASQLSKASQLSYGGSACACEHDAECRASGGAHAICLDAGSNAGRCVCGDGNSMPCPQGQRCTTAGQGTAGCM